MSNVRQRSNGFANGNVHSNGTANRSAKPVEPATTIARVYKPTEHGRKMDKKLDEHFGWEFGGPWGVSAMMLGFPVLMCKPSTNYNNLLSRLTKIRSQLGLIKCLDYLWICLWHYHGAFARPSNLSVHGKGGLLEYAQTMWNFVKTVSRGPLIATVAQRWTNHFLAVTLAARKDAYPTWFAFKSYGGLIVVQLLLAWIMPGVDQEGTRLAPPQISNSMSNQSLPGLPVPSLEYKSIMYHCNALSSFYTTIVLAITLHTTGLFRLPWLIESFGSLMTWSIIISFICTGLMYFSAVVFHYGGKPMRMSGNTVYDIFMGASLNPRLFTSRFAPLGRKNWDGVDLKMFAEVRVPWVLLFLIAVSGGVKQYEDLGYLSPWDMFHEKFGFMLIFWNMAGSPFTYCYPVIYMARSDPSTYKYPLWVNIAMYTTLCVAYYMYVPSFLQPAAQSLILIHGNSFDISMAQKSAFKMQQQGVYVPRKSFPQLPGAVVENPTFIETKHGNKLLTSGCWAYARKPNYAADWTQSLMWGLSAGLNTPITLFYPAFFLTVLTHRCGRDFERCAMKYGDE
ncbi:hypothetical protein QFC21_005039 [Naganishia friedmannii]|uniref:Uncharacterized protein n=1 Tax=Naganishia friedmannii TaxID=89922 RepID=A0ACC2VC74_9TREE|nr:hypothetical protein QFC21_005039 [Naganishia friedmannii]